VVYDIRTDAVIVLFANRVPADLDATAITELNLIANAETPPAAPADRPVDPAFQSRLVSVCNAAHRQARTRPFPVPGFNVDQPDVSKFPVIAAWEGKVLAGLQSWQSQLAALGQPRTGLNSWNTFKQRVDSDVQRIAALQVSADKADAAGFAREVHDFSSVSDADAKAAVALGVPSCNPSTMAV
jgi:hypothetical protein